MQTHPAAHIENQPKVYCYTRFSTPEQSQGDSHRRQTHAAEKWAERKEMILDQSLNIFDLGVSAYRGTNTDDDKGLGSFLTACRSNLIPAGSYLLVESLDRISRMTPRRAQRILDDIIDAGVTIATLNDGQEYDSYRMDNDPTALLISIMVAWRAHEESKTKGKRIAEAWAEKRKALRRGDTKLLTRRAPGWLLWTPNGWKIHKVHGETVKRIFKMTLEGVGEHSIAQTFNDKSVAIMGRGKLWHRSTISKILRNSSTIGELIPSKMDWISGKRIRVFEEPVKGVFPPVISQSDWLSVRALKDGKSPAIKGRGAAKPMKNLLSNLAKCPDCGAAMTRVNKGSVSKGGKPKLVCTWAKIGKAKHYRSIDIEAVHGAILSDWGKLVEEVPTGELGADLDLEYAERASTISALTDRLEAFSSIMNRHPSSTVAVQLQETEHEIARLVSDQDATDETRAMVDHGIVRLRLGTLIEAIGSIQDDGKAARINAVMRSLFSGVTVNHREGLLQFQWRQGGETSLRYAWTD